MHQNVQWIGVTKNAILQISFIFVGAFHPKVTSVD